MNKASTFLAGLGVVIGAQCFGEAVGCVRPVEPLSAAPLVERCKAEARLAFRDGGVDEAAAAYDRCIADGGAGAR